jgi:uncharacterized protein (DUF362 family)/SAM-dependent methyltransferase
VTPAPPLAPASATARSVVAAARVDYDAKDLRLEVHRAVRECMEEAGFRDAIDPHRPVAVKPNLCLDVLLPGHTTGPWALEGVLLALKDHVTAPISVIENDTWTTDCEQGVERAGLLPVIEATGVRWVNLARGRWRTVPLEGWLALGPEVDVPEILLESQLVTVPVMKTHGNTTLSGGIKNQWGCLKRVRLEYHEVIDEALVDVDRLMKPCFAVLDATVGCEGKGPKQGRPRIANLVLASPDNVALDATAARVMGLDPLAVRHLVLAAERGRGRIARDRIELRGDDVSGLDLAFKAHERTIITRVDLACRQPLLKGLLYRSPIFKLIVLLAKWNYPLWFLREGNALRDGIVLGSRYGAQWRKDGPVVRCPLCGGDAPRTLAGLRDVDGALERSFSVHRCGCGLGITAPSPTDEELARLYPETFYAKKGYGPLERFFLARRTAALARLARPGARVLDVGCGTGGFLDRARAKGFLVEGQEPSAAGLARSRDRGLTVHESLEPLPAGRFDAVTLWHVLEHARDPVALLAEARRVLAPGGVVLVAVPDAGSPEARLSGARFGLLDVPRHLFHFDRASLATALERAGLEPVAWDHASLEYGPPISFQTALNFVTRTPMFLWRTAKRGHRPRGAKERARFARDLAATFALAAVALVPIALASLVLGLLGRGAAMLVVARRRP